MLLDTKSYFQTPKLLTKMKHLTLFFFAVMTLIACDKNADQLPEVAIDLAAKMEGTYQGNYSSPLTNNASDYTISIVKIDENNVRITIPDFGGFDTGILTSSENENVWVSNLDEDLLSLSYNKNTKRLLFTRTTRTLSGEVAHLNFDGYKK
ncbi:MAG: hypothetical protein AAFO82_01095 [Bacteroidota bacterium]